MKQIDNDKTFTNAYIGPWFAISPETHQTLTNVKNSLATTIAVIKDYVRTNKPQFRNSILDEYK
ncbi:hypothetical protein C5F49_03325 [Nitrosopumilus oxyclinae]|uniref:Uncharacterized protein n=1 Tax=Nitrosopumilus oxyclinae TaxID=1959104 RepID=A0A7D5M2H8_9ARCH|nr:hypothetical protein [Nitrosopumilus oxyclinae]QLH04455.1 hypothetical protein C5F49_03325 [Nitrosopumilus oxyclinae]